MDLRLRGAMRLYLFLAFGVFLVSVPWSPIWDRTTLLLSATPVGPWVLGGAVRGAVSALGFLDLLVAAAEARALWSTLRRA